MGSQPPASEEQPQKLVIKGLRGLEVAEESAEATGNEALRRHPHLSGALPLAAECCASRPWRRLAWPQRGRPFGWSYQPSRRQSPQLACSGWWLAPRVATDPGKLATGAPASLGSLVTALAVYIVLLGAVLNAQLASRSRPTA